MIYDERIRFRAIERDDLQTFVEWFNDPEVTAGLTMFQPMSMAQEEGWFTNMLKRPPVEQPLGIEIQQGDGWKLIGNVGLHNIDWRVRCAEMGIVIGEKQYWNQGYGTEAMQLLLKHGFETLNFNRMSLVVYADNPRAIRSYEKAGFVKEGTLRQAIYHRGHYDDVITMSVLRSDWDSKHTERLE